MTLPIENMTFDLLARNLREMAYGSRRSSGPVSNDERERFKEMKDELLRRIAALNL